jgi:Uma2 family endonuclease
MSTIVIGEQVRIPAWVVDQNSFRRWACCDDYPRQGWFSHLNGELWVDWSMERLSHNQIKTIIAAVLTMLVKTSRLGRFLSDRMLLTNLDAFLSTEPDGMYISYEALKSGRAELQEGDDSMEVLGSPNMALEVVSKSSVKKDTEILRDLYWQAGIDEYWLVDSRSEEPTLEILRHTSRKYVTTKSQSGWVKSAVFGKSFKLTRESNSQGLSEYNLLVR